jgi:hypothetical protein
MSEISKAEPQSREAFPKSRAVDHTLWPYGVCAFLLHRQSKSSAFSGGIGDGGMPEQGSDDGRLSLI